MSESRWVQHMSGQGEKFVLRSYGNDCGGPWTTATGFILPKSDYCYCEPPESDAWVDVTATCDIDTDYSLLDHPEEGGHGWRIFAPAGLFIGQYRLRKIEINQHNYEGMQWAFIVERRTL